MSEEEKAQDHPLQNNWVLWEHKAGGQGNKSPNQWKDNMQELCHFSSVEEFWRYFNHIPKVSQVFYDGECRKKVGPEGKMVEEYSLFKRGIEPEWGDPANVTGGEWFCRQYLEGEILDLYWENLVLAVIGETIEEAVGGDGDVVNGVRVVDKSKGMPTFKLEIWLNSRDPQVKEKVKAKLLEVMTYGQPVSRKMQPKFEWKNHT